MVSRFLVLSLRALEFVWTLLIMALIGNIIAEAFSGNPSVINYAIFVATFSMLSLFYLFAAAISDSYVIHAALPLLVDGLNVIFFFCAAIALAAELEVHSCNNKTYTHSNRITNGAHNTAHRCREAQASTAFLWFGWACYTASLFFSFLDARGNGVNLRSRGIRKGGPAMSQV
ncbi:hypothetical protein DV736_g3922, partial [Chaetothyriales sp. CBS 134916]